MVDDRRHGCGYLHEEKEFRARAHPKGRRLPLICLSFHTKQARVERHLLIQIVSHHGEVADEAGVEQTFLHRRFGPARFTHQAGTATVAGVLYLYYVAIGVAEVEFGRAFFGAAGVFPAHADACFQRSPAQSAAAATGFGFADAMRRQNLQSLIHTEAGCVQTQMIDSRLAQLACRAQCDECRPVAHPQQRHHPLMRLDRHAEQSLIKLQRPLDVGTSERHVIQLAHRENRPRLCSQPRGGCGGGRSQEELTAGNRFCHFPAILTQFRLQCLQEVEVYIAAGKNHTHAANTGGEFAVHHRGQRHRSRGFHHNVEFLHQEPHRAANLVF